MTDKVYNLALELMAFFIKNEIGCDNCPAKDCSNGCAIAIKAHFIRQAKSELKRKGER